MRAIHLLITGHVQDVFFRRETKKKADALRLRGWVRNSANGSVEIVAEGEEQPLQELIEWAWHGPPSAKVHAVEQTEQMFHGFTAFEIKE